MTSNDVNTTTSNSTDTTAANGVCPDWIYSNASNVHVANDLSWFKSYRPFSSHLTSTYALDAPFPVMGIGTVELAVKATPSSFTVYGSSTSCGGLLLNGKQVAYFRPVSCQWPNEERARWQSIQAQGEPQHAPPPPPPPYEDSQASTELDQESEIRASAPRAPFF